MTLTSPTNRNNYTANGSQTAFAYQFRIDDATHLGVYLADVLQSSGFSVSGVGNDAGGNVTFTTAPANGTKVTLIRAVPYTQPTDIPTQGPLSSDSLEKQLDQTIMQVLQLKELIDRTLVQPPSTGTTSLQLPTLVASQFLGVNAAANGLLWGLPPGSGVPISTFMQTVVDDASADAALTTLGGGTTGKSLFGAATAAAGRETLAAANSRDALVGLSLALNGTDPSNDIDIGSGVCRDGADTVDMILSSTLVKQLDAAWAVGTNQGGLDTGAKAANTSYYVWVTMLVVRWCTTRISLAG